MCSIVKDNCAHVRCSDINKYSEYKMNSDYINHKFRFNVLYNVNNDTKKT